MFSKHQRKTARKKMQEEKEKDSNIMFQKF